MAWKRFYWLVKARVKNRRLSSVGWQFANGNSGKNLPLANDLRVVPKKFSSVYPPLYLKRICHNRQSNHFLLLVNAIKLLKITSSSLVSEYHIYALFFALFFQFPL